MGVPLVPVPDEQDGHASLFYESVPPSAVPGGSISSIQLVAK